MLFSSFSASLHPTPAGGAQQPRGADIEGRFQDPAAERRIVFETTGVDEVKPKAAMTSDELIAAQRLVRRLPVGESVVDAILKLVRSARPGPDAGDLGKLIAWGPSPRASQALMLVTRARALIDAGAVNVGGAIARKFDAKVEASEVLVNGQPLEAPDGLLAMLHKQVRDVCTHADGEGPTIYELLPPRWLRR